MGLTIEFIGVTALNHKPLACGVRIAATVSTSRREVYLDPEQVDQFQHALGRFFTALSDGRRNLTGPNALTYTHSEDLRLHARHEGLKDVVSIILGDDCPALHKAPAHILLPDPGLFQIRQALEAAAQKVTAWHDE